MKPGIIFAIALGTVNAAVLVGTLVLFDGRLGDANTRIDTIAGHVDQVSGDLAASQKNGASAADVTGLNAKVVELQAALARVPDSIGYVAKKVDVVLAALNTQDTRLKYLAGLNGALRSGLDTMDQRLKSLAARDETLISTFKAVDSRFDYLVTLGETLRAGLDAIDGRVKGTASRIAILENGLQLATDKTRQLELKVEGAFGDVTTADLIPGAGGPRPVYTIVRTGHDLLIRKPYKVGFDLVERFEVGRPASASSNGVIDFIGARLIPADVTPERTRYAFAQSTMIRRSGGDEAPNISLNGMHLGGGHGLGGSYLIRSEGHGQASGDELTDDADKRFVVVDVPDSDHLKITAANTGSSHTLWRIGSPPIGSLHAGSSKTLPIGFISPVQIYPVVQNYRWAILLDGTKQITGNGVYFADTVKLVESYGVINPASLLEQLAGGVLLATNSLKIETQVGLDIARSFSRTGMETRHVGVFNNQKYDRGYWGRIQQQHPHLNAGETLKLYVPESPQLAGGIDVTTLTHPIVVDKTIWADRAEPPSRAVMMVEKDGVPQWGEVVG